MPLGRSGLGERAGDSRPGTQCAEEPRPATTVPACRGLGHSDRGPSVWGPEVFAPAEGARDAGLTPSYPAGELRLLGPLGDPAVQGKARGRRTSQDTAAQFCPPPCPGVC